MLGLHWTGVPLWLLFAGLVVRGLRRGLARGRWMGWRSGDVREAGGASMVGSQVIAYVTAAGTVSPAGEGRIKLVE